MLIERAVKDTILETSETFPVVLLTGPRQVGKSTLLESLAEPSRKRVTLDNPTVRALAKNDPELFLQRYAPPVLIDEVQYAPELFPYIKILVDKRKQCGDFWLTGSQMFRTMKNVTETLAGRVGVIPILGLSNSEINGTHLGVFSADPQALLSKLPAAKPMSVTEIFERIFCGSMPRLYENSKVNLNTYFESYLDTYVSRDVRDLSQVGDESAFLKFVKVVAARTATNLNYDALATETGVSGPTAKSWLSILVSSGIVTLIEPYFNNALKRVIKAPRMYFSDTGLCAHLMGWGSPEVLENSSMSGEFFETWVVMEVYKSYLNAGVRPPLYFYRDSNRKEIDLIIYQNGTVHPLEIKKGSAPKDAIKNFSVLNPIQEAKIKTEIGAGGVICLASDVVPINAKNNYIPAWII
ncbi:ATP-binding protein [Fibrobacter sp.]|uniref:ATP-binding protein n=1 Tax=Fibrobacter sp. TaxID=35828 RepID=UPI00389045BA